MRRIRSRVPVETRSSFFNILVSLRALEVAGNNIRTTYDLGAPPCDPRSLTRPESRLGAYWRGPGEGAELAVVRVLSPLTLRPLTRFAAQIDLSPTGRGETELADRSIKSKP